jgi:translation elongation factor EF-Tu-like GTPase
MVFNPPRDCDLEAEVHFLRTAEGGRQSAAGGNGVYRPTHDFGMKEFFNDGIHIFVGKDLVAPGDSVVSKIWLLSPESLHGRLRVGQRFTVNEGRKIVANAVITRIVNGSLEQANP